MSYSLKIKDAFPSGKKAIVISGKGVSTVMFGSPAQPFLKCAFEEVNALGIEQGFVYLPAESSKLDFQGIYEAAPNAVAETDAGGNTLVVLRQSEFLNPSNDQASNPAA